MLLESIPAQDPTRPSFITPFGLAVEACSELRKQSRVFLRAQGAGREIGSGWQYLNTFFIPETVQFGGFIMRTWLASAALLSRRMAKRISAVAALLTAGTVPALAQPEGGGGEASLKLP